MSERRYTLYRCEEFPPPANGGATGGGRGGKRGAGKRGRTNGGTGRPNGANGGRGNGPNGRTNGTANGPSASSQSTPPRDVYARPRRRWATVLRYATLFLFASICGYAGYWWGFLDASFAEMHDSNKGEVNPADIVVDERKEGEAVNILVIGSDRRDDIPGDQGRSDTMMLVRLDPESGSISMLSVPRDLWVTIPGHGSERINVAYMLDQDKGAVEVFKELTGLPIHHYIDVNFLGFIRIVDTLGGVYIDVDKRYYNPPGTGWSAIDVPAGYQLLNGRHALQFVRFRHDNLYDFGRMQRQQIFLHEVERQAKRWGNFTKLQSIIKAITKNTRSDIGDVTEVLGMAKMVLGLDTSQVYKTHVEGTATMIDSKSVLLPSEQEIKNAVSDFTDPQQAPIATGKITIPKDTYTVRVLNGSGMAGLAGQVAAKLTDQGYVAQEDGNADSFDYTKSVVYATAGLESSAKAVADKIKPCLVKVVNTLPGTLDGITVVVGKDYTGVKAPNETVAQAQIQEGVNQDLASWQTWQSKVKIELQMPTAWSPGMSYDLDQWRSYTVKTPEGQRAAFVAVGHTVNERYWHVQALAWSGAPILADPNEQRTVNGIKYSLYYEGARLHRVAWHSAGRVYWITNTLDDQISNKVLLGLATSCKPVPK